MRSWAPAFAGETKGERIALVTHADVGSGNDVVIVRDSSGWAQKATSAPIPALMRVRSVASVSSSFSHPSDQRSPSRRRSAAVP